MKAQKWGNTSGMPMILHKKIYLLWSSPTRFAGMVFKKNTVLFLAGDRIHLVDMSFWSSPISA
jgi:hypothetical protein